MLREADLDRHIGKYYGKYSGIVKDNQPALDDPDENHRGYVAVTVPSMFGDTIQVIARPCLPYGHFFIPDNETKVWIEFEGGDPAFPLWVGAWYPKDAPPKPAAISPPDNRVIQTPSGHTIEIMDKKDEERITITHKVGSSITISKDGSVQIVSQKAPADGGGDPEKHAQLVFDTEKKEASLTFYPDPRAEKGHTIQITGDGFIVTHKEDKGALEITADHVLLRRPDKGTLEVTDDHVLLQKSADESLQLTGDKVVLKKAQTTLELTGSEATVSATTVNLKAGSSTLKLEGASAELTGPMIKLGAGTTPAVMGKELLQAIVPFLVALGTHTHPTSAPGAPTAPPASPIQLDLSQAISKKVLIE